MRKWLCLALAMAPLACTGGRDPVRTISGNGEYAGPGVADPFDDGQSGNPITSSSTLVALCIKACAHVRAKDCESAPAHTVDACEFVCTSEVEGVAAWCADESAAVYECTADAKVTCSGGFSDAPQVEDCDSEVSDLQECLSPGSGCVTSPQNDLICLEMGFSTFLVCSEGINAPPQCIQITSSAFCCP